MLDRADYIQEGLRRLQQEALDSGILGEHQEVRIEVTIRGTSFYRYQTFPQPSPGGPSVHIPFSENALDSWAEELKRRSYVPGVGTWMKVEIQLHKDAPGQVKFLDDNVTSPAHQFEVGPKPKEYIVELAAFPRTPDRIPPWMWAIFKEAELQPPIYNPEFKAVDWKNKRRPVSDLGTDLTAESVVIDTSLEPGVFAKIGRKLFGA
ncbi:hypothetical protein [Arthrobacter sp. ISL-95]|uniref:hypothetical protein n=1 Tax=Arthrobacter sp. ISL-95 TaxID=2819116 RepID=UPI001BE56665|nr:hypothetical protein [Arthrobacter sp. ISL-95]MBT2584484.1 hypothetical protein [Arthrobacter sp. ISL-95]